MEERVHGGQNVALLMRKLVQLSQEPSSSYFTSQSWFLVVASLSSQLTRSCRRGKCQRQAE